MQEHIGSEGKVGEQRTLLRMWCARDTRHQRITERQGVEASRSLEVIALTRDSGIAFVTCARAIPAFYAGITHRAPRRTERPTLKISASPAYQRTQIFVCSVHYVDGLGTRLGFLCGPRSASLSAITQRIIRTFRARQTRQRRHIPHVRFPIRQQLMARRLRIP